MHLGGIADDDGVLQFPVGDGADAAVGLPALGSDDGLDELDEVVAGIGQAFADAAGRAAGLSSGRTGPPGPLASAPGRCRPPAPT